MRILDAGCGPRPGDDATAAARPVAARPGPDWALRIVIALGGNTLASPDGRPAPRTSRRPWRRRRSHRRPGRRPSGVSKARLVITAVIVKGRTQSEVAAAYGVSTSRVNKLVARYNAEGETAFEPRSGRPKTASSCVGIPSPTSA